MIARIKGTVRHLIKGLDKRWIPWAMVILEDQMGHAKSVETHSCIDQNGNAIPWFTYPAIHHIEQLDLSNLTMLEWGSGNSSTFFSKRVKHLTSIEHDTAWFEKVKGLNLAKHSIYNIGADKYAEFPLTLNTKFDIVCVDAIERVACAVVALKLINAGGLIIVDNSDRHPDICQSLRDADLIEVDMHGFGPINQYTWTTSFFFTRDYRVSPLTRQPVIPIGGGY